MLMISRCLSIMMLIVALVVMGGCGGSSGTTTVRGPSPTQTSDRHTVVGLRASERRKLHGKAQLIANDGRQLGVAILEPGQSDATRTLRLLAKGLPPTRQRYNYAIWLSAIPQQMVMLGVFEVGRGGAVLRPEIQFPDDLTRNLENGAYLALVLTRTNRAHLEATLRQLPDRDEYSPYTGRKIAQGVIAGPIVGARPGIGATTRALPEP